jgi:transposase-like protein
MGERRSFSQELKKKAVQQMQQGCNVAALARELGVRRKLLYEWRDRMAGRPVSKGHGAKSGAAAPAAPAASDWKQVAGTLALENRFLAQALRRVEERRRNSAVGSSTVSGKKSGPSTSSKAD